MVVVALYFVGLQFLDKIADLRGQNTSGCKLVYLSSFLQYSLSITFLKSEKDHSLSLLLSSSDPPKIMLGDLQVKNHYNRRQLNILSTLNIMSQINNIPQATSLE